MQTGRLFQRSRPPASPEAGRWQGPLSTKALDVVVLLTVGLLLLAAVLSYVGHEDRRSATASVPRDSSAGVPLLGTTVPHPEDRLVLDSCRALWKLQQGVLAAARPAMGQWEVHIGAMNQLVAGRITFAQATVFWNSTRVQAADRVRAFQAADRLFRSTAGSLCPEATTPSRPASGALKSCLEAVDAGDAAVRAARTTMVTWSRHVRDMERMRMGTLSPTMAAQMWQMTWKKGDRELRTFRSDEAAARELRCAG